MLNSRESMNPPAGAIPKLLNELSTKDLHDLVTAYPWFHLAVSVYLSRLKHEDENLYEAEMKRLSHKLADRALLYRWMYSSPEEYVEAPVEESFILEDKVEPAPALEESLDQPESGLESELLDIVDVLPQNQMPSDEENLDLIEQFIKENPRIKPSMDAPENQIDISRPSSEFNEQIVTEPLAKILISQGHYQRAIEAYEKLILKYPEKNTYFAGLIEEVRNLINKQ
jgi:tetratricopeptide (TPR) repeat protein